MLDRVALHQTRLRTPGISLDAKGVALGSKMLLLLPSLDRLVGLIALYSEGGSLVDLLGSLAIHVVRSKLGSREFVLTVSAEDSGRCDRLAELARLSGGFAFTGSNRHFVQYRDARAPFGYDLRELRPSNAALCLAHNSFSQDYDRERPILLEALLSRLQPRLAPSSESLSGRRWLCAEEGLGMALIHYFVRSNVSAQVGLAQWPPASEFDERPIQRYIFDVAELPARMVPMLRSTPGVTVFVPEGEGCAVEFGYEHPVNLAACPVFPAEGLVLLFGADKPALRIDKLPAMGAVSSFARVAANVDAKPSDGTALAVRSVAVDLRLAPSNKTLTEVTATIVNQSQLGLLREIAYRLSTAQLQDTQIALCEAGAVLYRKRGIEAIPIGNFYRSIGQGLFVAAGYTPIPNIAAAVLRAAFDAPADTLLFLGTDDRRLGLPKSAFVSLEQAIVSAESWSGSRAESVAQLQAISPPVVTLTSPGFRPMRDVKPVHTND
jgi:hypothetical protein